MNRLRVLALILTVAFGAFLIKSQTAETDLDDTYYGLIGRADKAIEDGNWASAEEYLMQALTNEPQHPTNVLVMSNLGLVQYNLARYSLAVETLSKAHAIAPRSVTILSNRAQVYEALGCDSLAYADYSRVLELDSALIDPLYAHAMLAMRMGKMDVTSADCARLEKLAPNDESTHRALAAYYSVSQRWIDALPHFTAILEKQPTADDYCGRAVCYLMLNRLNEASADISSGLELDPENRSLYFYRAHLNKARYRSDDARADMKKALE